MGGTPWLGVPADTFLVRGSVPTLPRAPSASRTGAVWFFSCLFLFFGGFDSVFFLFFVLFCSFFGFRTRTRDPVTSRSQGNNFTAARKLPYPGPCRERLRTKELKWSDPSPNPTQAGATCTWLPFFSLFFWSVSSVKHGSASRLRERSSASREAK